MSKPATDPLITKHFWVRAILSFGIAAPALFLIISPNFTPNDKNWAFGTVGTVLGYWLKQ